MTEPSDDTQPRRRRTLRVAAALALVVSAALAGIGLYVAAERRALDAPLAVPVDGYEVVVPPGTSLGRVARELADAGLLAHPRALTLYARWHGLAGGIKAGEYRVEPGTTPIGLLEQLTSGRVVQHALTIVEGWTFEQLLDAISANDRIEHTLDGLSHAEIMARIGAPGVHPEGRFFADTFHFPRGTRDVDFLRRAYAAMDEFLDREWAARADGLPLKSPDEALILASIVEKETGEAGERPRIAGVFIERLRKGMRLETDPTVIYGMGDAFDGNLRRRDLRADTPYNTYTRKGLPPTPIAIPGPDAIRAALHPQIDGALYFVSKGDGSHHFSATYEEHRQAVNRYQKRRRRSTGG